jgi:hypothetical protein
MTFAKGDIVSLAEGEVASRTRAGACTEAELVDCVVVATKVTDAGQVVKVRTRAHDSLGWIFARNLRLVRRA